MQCGSCVSTINSSLLKINGVFGIEANIAEKSIMLDHTPDVDLQQVSAELTKLGYTVELLDEDNFAHKAADWDANPMRVALAEKFVRQVLAQMPIAQEACLMDFGCGTGLVGLQFAPYVSALVMVDSSKAMLDMLQAKIDNLALSIPIELCHSGLETVKTTQVDAIVSSMAFHHLEDVQTEINSMYKLLKPDGFIAIADLVKEDGSFHGQESVPHNGFEQTDICQMLSNAGFKLHLCEIFNKINKENKEYPQFIIIAKK